MICIYQVLLVSRVGELVVAIDLSGSIGSELGFFVSELKSVCEMCNPEVVKVLWWDTAVSGIQTFTDIDYAGTGDYA
jgi:predicted metal-dependent peptidase